MKKKKEEEQSFHSPKPKQKVGHIYVMYHMYVRGRINGEEVLIKLQATHKQKRKIVALSLSPSDICRLAGVCKKQFKSPSHLINSERREESQQVHILCI